MGYILITGAGGFIGRNLVNYINETDPDSHEKIVLLSDSLFSQQIVVPSNNYHFTKKDFLEKGIATIETVIHVGAFTPKNHASFNFFHENYQNVTNTANLLKNLPQNPQKFIYLSTTDVYSRGKEIIDEQTQTAPSTFYGKCKLFCEHMVTEHCTGNNIILQVLRLGNIYGTGETAYKKLIPETIRHILHDEAPVLYGSGRQKRSFLHVHDCISAIWKSVELSESIGFVNIVSTPSHELMEIAETLIKISGKSLDISTVTNNADLYDINYDNNKMMKHLVQEKVTLFDGLTEEYVYEKAKLQTSRR